MYEKGKIMNQIHIISGLPRSGSTLLSAILNQNPLFSAGISSALIDIIEYSISLTTTNLALRHEWTDSRRSILIEHIIAGVYPSEEQRVFFDTNRRWSSKLDLINQILPTSKVICCVRDIPSILNSFESLFRKHPLNQPGIIPPERSTTVHDRCDYLMLNDGIVGLALHCLSEGLYSSHNKNLILIEYEGLCKQPKQTMEAIYKFLNIDYFEHDFNNVASQYDAYDADLQVPTMHTTRPVVSWKPAPFILPPQIIERYSNMEVWRK